jgi:pimeloyl-ACP methyl ester carboxylesterase
VSSFVVVHGGFGGGWEWRLVEERLRTRGHDVTRPTLTGLGERSHLAVDVDLGTHVEDVVQHLLFEGLDDVVLVGQSYGGMVVTGVADRVPERIGALVYVDAFVPRDGESLFDLVPAEMAAFFRGSAVDGRVPPPSGAPAGYPAWYVARSRPHPLACFEQPIALARGAHSIPTTYIKCVASDIPLDTSVERARETGWTMREIATHHDAQIADPDGLAGLLSAAAA